MPLMEEFLNQISIEKTRAPNEPLWISKKDLEYAYGQLKLSQKTRKHCNFTKTGGKTNGSYGFKKNSTVYRMYRRYSKKVDRTLNYQTPLWLDNKIIITKGDKDRHRKNLFKILK